jgi:hypothetical protein
VAALADEVRGLKGAFHRSVSILCQLRSADSPIRVNSDPSFKTLSRPSQTLQGVKCADLQ